MPLVAIRLVGVVIQNFFIKPDNIKGFRTSDKQHLH